MTASLPRRWYSSGVWITGKLRHAGVARLLELERGVGARELALQEAHFLVPGHRHEVDVLEAPVVVLLADAGGAGLLRRLGVEPGDEGTVASRAARIARLERSPAAGGLFRQRVERVDLPAHRAGAGDPEVVRIAGEVAARLLEERRDDARAAVASFPSSSRESGYGIGPQLDEAVMRRALVRGRVALLVPDALVEGRVARPGLEHARVEVEAVHLGAHERLVDACLDRPGARVDRLEAAAEALQVLQAPRKGRGGVVGRAVAQRRPFEGAPLLEELHERVIDRAPRAPRRRVPAAQRAPATAANGARRRNAIGFLIAAPRERPGF